LAVGAHNDVLMVLAIVIALWLLQRERWLFGLLALLLAAHVKLTALLLLPVVGLWLIQRFGWRAAVTVRLVALLCMFPLSWLLYAPLGGWATLLFCLLAGALMVVLLDLGALFYRSTKSAMCDERALWSCGLAVIVAYLLVGSFWLMPWYGLWALPLAALLPASRCLGLGHCWPKPRTAAAARSRRHTTAATIAW
jgi:hypothetical protein